MKRIVVLRGGALGDVLLGFPALRALRGRFPAATLHLVAPLPQARLAVDIGLATSVTGLDDPALVPLFLERASLDRLPSTLRGVDLSIVWLQGADVIARNLGRLTGAHVLAAKALPEAGSGVHASDWLWGTLAELGIPAEPHWDRQAWLSVPPPAQAWATAWLDEQFGGAPFIVLHPGSGSGRKNWPADAWAGVVARVQERYPLPLVVTAGPADAAPLEAWRTARGAMSSSSTTGARATRATFAPSPGRGAPASLAMSDVTLAEPALTHLAGVLQRASLYLGNDSGVTHLAAGLGVPTVAVFGPTDPSLWRPRGPHVRALGGLPGGWPDHVDVLHGAITLLGASGGASQIQGAAE